LKSKDKTIEFQRFSLRSGKTILKEGGHVTPIYTDQRFRLLYDNFRKVETLLEEIDLSKQMLDTQPFKSIDECKTIRTISAINKKIVYYRTLHKILPGSGVYKSRLDLAIRTFIKGILTHRYNLEKYSEKFKTYNAIIEFIHKYDPKVKITKPMISNYKNRKVVFKCVPREKSAVSFIDFVKKELPDFDNNEFFQ
jgi:hypothetical protein